MSVNKFVLNETSYFGKGAREELPEEIRKRGFRKVLVVTDKTLLECGVTGKVIEVLDKAEIRYEVYSEINSSIYFFNSRAFIFLLFFLFPVDMISTLSLCLSTASRPCCAPLLPHSKALSSKRQDLHTFGA